ncbi:Possible hemagglutinin (DUF637) [Providencia rettgeri]|uniref:Possible hemagglutinin (DUF637) n=1 Tax=Providencia rettgeri TaxID=587 RepID=A0A379FNR0_PRORE|nr:Possible hemagglutinin (DUF637) [Providencia rettgeri]
MNFKAVKNSQFEQVITNSNGFYITQRNKGYTSDKWILPSLHIGGKLTVDANKGITADVKTKEGQSFEQALAILSRTPGYEWLGDVKNNKNINWAVVKDAYSQWDIKTESLNPVVGAVIAIAVAAATYGTSTAASVGGLASSTATSMGASATTASMASAAAQAGFASLVSQASVALVENKGNLSKTLSSLGQSDTAKSIVTSMIIAGSLEGFDIALYGKVTDPAKVTLPKLSDGNWTQVAQRVVGQSAISSTIGTAIQGGSFTDNFKTALLSNVAGQIQAEGANLIGDKFQYLYVDKQGKIIGHAGKTLSHMALAGLSAEISGANVKGAVVGALAAELAAITLNSKLFEPKYLNEQERQLALVQDAIKGNEAKTQFTKVLGGLAGALITHKPEGAFSAANSAELVYTYNYTEHQLQQIIIENNLDMMAAAKGDKAAAKRVTARQEAAIFVGFVAAGGYVAVIGGEIVLAASPEILAAAKLGMQGCKAGLVLCINKLAISSAEVIAPETAISSGAALGAGYKLLASSEEAAKALASTTMNSSKHMLMAGKQDASKLKSLLDAEKLRVEANKKVIEEINKFSSKNKARDTATMVAAYDIKSGTIIVKGSVGNKIEADMLHKDTITLLKKKLGGADVGTKTIYCNNIVGGCGEVLAADQLIRQGVKPTDIRISQAYRPRDAHGFDISEVPPEALVSTCKNCIKVFVE